MIPWFPVFNETYYPTLLIYNSYNVPLPQEELKKEQVESEQKKQTIFPEQSLKEKEFVKRIEEELQRSNIYSKKKFWIKEQDDLLKFLFEQEHLTWKQISLKIENTNEKICERRYTRITENEKAWSKEEEEKIKYLKQIEHKKWKQISQVIKNRSSKQIRERYLNFLRSDLIQEPWRIEEDVRILINIKKYGKKWKILEKQIEGRSENQLKNRYYGTLSFIEKKLKKKLRKQKQKLKVVNDQ